MKSMRALLVILLFAATFVPAAAGPVEGSAERAAQSKLDLTQPYLLLTTIKTSTMQEELNEAAAAGYRVIVGARTGLGEFCLLLERAVQPPPEAYQYLLLATSRTSTMQKELDEAAAKGFRLLPGGLMSGQSEIVVVLERPPGPPSLSQYLLLATTFTGTLQKELEQAADDSYQLVGMVRAEEQVGLKGEHVVILEKPAQRTSGVAEHRAREPKHDVGERYRLLATRRTSTMQNELNKAARTGYRVLVASPTSGTEIAVLLEKATPPETFQYKLLATNRPSTLQRELNEAATKGFRLLRQTVVGKRGAGSSGFGRLIGVGLGELTIPGTAPDEIVAVVEKAPGPGKRYQYLVLDTLRTSTMQQEISKAVREGYQVAAIAGSPRSEEGTPMPVVANLRVLLEKEVKDD